MTLPLGPKQPSSELNKVNMPMDWTARNTYQILDENPGKFGLDVAKCLLGVEMCIGTRITDQDTTRTKPSWNTERWSIFQCPFFVEGTWIFRFVDTTV